MSDYKYRIKFRFIGFEPQMKYIAGITGKSFWTPLLVTGYWAEPSSYSCGSIKNKYLLSFSNAKRAIERAKRINGDGLLEIYK